ncbi:MAG: MmgE/PrpD family protein [Chloroflexi bacterium]|nr:MmgE/PrpD family protein [Chloroflexota bacterium]
MGATEEISRFIVEWPTERIPDEILHYGKRCLVNYFSVALCASTDPSLDILLDHFREEGGNPRASIIGRGGRTTLPNAALANGYLGHFEDFDDTHIPFDYRDNIHPSSPIYPAPLAAGEYLGASGREVLAAGVIGIEVALRVGMGISATPGGRSALHITATCGILGAAAAAGRLLGLNAEQMAYALGTAATQASGLTDNFGSMCKPLHAGRAAQGGLVAALLAKRGFTSSRSILEAPSGFMHAMSAEPDVNLVTKDLGQWWEIPRVGLKPYSCGAGNHALIDAVLTLREKDGVTLDNIESMTGRLRGLAAQLIRTRHPRTNLEAKFSFFHTMAAAFVDGQVLPAQFTEAKALDPQIASLRDRIELTSDSGLSGRNAVVTVTLKDGRSYTERVDHPTGTPERPMSDEQIGAKFRGLAKGVLPDAQGEDLLSSLWKVDDLADVREVMQLASAAGSSV